MKNVIRVVVGLISLIVIMMLTGCVYTEIKAHSWTDNSDVKSVYRELIIDYKGIKDAATTIK